MRTLLYQYPFVNSTTKQAIASYGDYGRTTGDWKPLLHQMSQALNQDLLHGPFFFHAEMLIKKKRAYNWCIVEIDYDSIHWLEKFLASIGGYPRIAERYREFFGVCPAFSRHLPARILAANHNGNAGQPSQIAWFLDQFLPDIGPQDNMQNVCGLELISSWEARFSEIYMPGLHNIFDIETTDKITDLLADFPLSAVATFAAIIHDTGHGSGPNACLPAVPAYARKMPMRWYGAIGELTTVLAALALLFDIAPFLTAFILLFRLFDYIRAGFATDRRQAWLNQDYDSLAGAFLFQRLLKSGTLSRTNKGYHIELDGIREFSYQILAELHRLGTSLAELTRTEQASQIKRITGEYFAQHVERDQQGHFLISDEHRAFLDKGMHLPLKPSWKNMQKYYKFQHLLQIDKWQSNHPLSYNRA